MLFTCEWAKAVWFGFNIHVFGDLGGNASVVKWTAEMVDKLPNEEASSFMGRMALISWYIWKSRNESVFCNSKVNPLASIASINHALFKCSNMLEIPRVHMDNPSIQEEVSTWRAPDRGSFKVNCDVAIPSNGGEGKMAVVLRNWKGKVLDGFARTVSICKF